MTVSYNSAERSGIGRKNSQAGLLDEEGKS